MYKLIKDYVDYTRYTIYNDDKTTIAQFIPKHKYFTSYISYLQKNALTGGITQVWKNTKWKYNVKITEQFIFVECVEIIYRYDLDMNFIDAE